MFFFLDNIKETEVIDVPDKFESHLFDILGLMNEQLQIIKLIITGRGSGELVPQVCARGFTSVMYNNMNYLALKCVIVKFLVFDEFIFLI